MTDNDSVAYLDTSTAITTTYSSDHADIDGHQLTAGRIVCY